MNIIIRKLSLATFIPEMYLKQARFTNSACQPCTKKQEKEHKI